MQEMRTSGGRPFYGWAVVAVGTLVAFSSGPGQSYVFSIFLDSIIGLGFAASNAVIPPVSRALIEWIGWRGAYVVLGVMIWVLVIPAGLFIVRDRPEDMGLYPDGAREAPEGETRVRATRGGADRRVPTSLPFWQLAVPMSARSLIVTALVFHQVSIFGERGVSASVAAGVFVAYAIASAGWLPRGPAGAE